MIIFQFVRELIILPLPRSHLYKIYASKSYIFTSEYIKVCLSLWEKDVVERYWKILVQDIWYSCLPATLIWLYNYDQQDATISDYLFLQGSTCFARCLRPSSGAHNCTFSFRYCQTIVLQAGIVDEMEFHLIHDTSLQQYWLTIPEAECTVMCSWWWVEAPPETCRAL